jgi:PPOX class probable F420-dependent enzyme
LRFLNEGGGVHLEREEALRRAAAADHATLGTLNRTGAADLVPVCFAIVDEWLGIPIDSVKPKGSTALGRTRNLERDPRATLLAEHWDAADWTRLWWVRLSLSHAPAPPAVEEVLIEALRVRYPQYRDAPFTQVLAFRIGRVGGWSASKPSP